MEYLFCRKAITTSTSFALFRTNCLDLSIPGEGFPLSFLPCTGRFAFMAASTKFYLFRVGQDGSYSLSRYLDGLGAHARVLARGLAPAIHIGLGQFNLVTVIAYADRFYLYLNKHFIGSAKDSSLHAGYIGIVAYTDEKQAEVIYNHAQVWKL